MLFEHLKLKFPARFLILRYEDLVATTEPSIERLFEFCGLGMTEQVREFIRLSKARDDGQSYGVFRDARQRKGDWTRELDPQIIEAIRAELRGGPLARYLTESC